MQGRKHTELSVVLHSKLVHSVSTRVSFTRILPWLHSCWSLLFEVPKAGLGWKSCDWKNIATVINIAPYKKLLIYSTIPIQCQGSFFYIKPDEQDFSASQSYSHRSLLFCDILHKALAFQRVCVHCLTMISESWSIACYEGWQYNHFFMRSLVCS